MSILYKVMTVRDKDGNLDVERMSAIRNICKSMTGEILYPQYVKPGYCLCLLWNDDTGRMMRTSQIETVELGDNWIKVTTLNRIYELVESDYFENQYDDDTFVYCTKCQNFRVDEGENPCCQYSGLCDLLDCEESKSYKERPMHKGI